MAYAVINGPMPEKRIRGRGSGDLTKENIVAAAEGKKEEEPEPLRQLKRSVNGTLRRREDMLKSVE